MHTLLLGSQQKQQLSSSKMPSPAGSRRRSWVLACALHKQQHQLLQQAWVQKTPHSKLDRAVDSTKGCDVWAELSQQRQQWIQQHLLLN
jgi:hypothetical protein